MPLYCVYREWLGAYASPQLGLRVKPTPAVFHASRLALATCLRPKQSKPRWLTALRMKGRWLMLRNNETAASSGRWLTQESAAKYLSISVRQLQALQQAKRITASYFLGPRSPRYDARLLDQQLAEQQTESPAESSGGVRLAAG